MTIKLSELREHAAKAEAKNLLPTVEASVVLRLLEIAEAALVAAVSWEEDIRAMYGLGDMHPVTAARLDRDLEPIRELRKALEGVEP